MKTTTKRMTKSEAIEQIAAILSLLGQAVDLDEVVAEAVDSAQIRRYELSLRASYVRLRDDFANWAAFVADAIEVGEWNPDWGTPTETD